MIESFLTATFAYDAFQREVSQTDGRGNTTHTVYDNLGRVASSIDALGYVTTYGYDALGRQVSVTDPLTNTVTTAYDAEGRVLSQRGATYPVDYTYDEFGEKISMTTYRDLNASGDATRWLYDEASGVMTNKVYADGNGPKYNYTPDGKLSQRTWARGIVTDYSYDGWGNLTNTVYSDDTPTVSLAYDVLGSQTEARDAAGVTMFLYDSFGSLTNETVIGVAGTNTIERYWDGYGRTMGYALNGTRQTTIGYEPDKGRIGTMGIPNIHSTTTTNLYNYFRWTYLPGTDIKSSLAYPNGLTASWTYDANNQLLQVCNATPTNVISQYDYIYDAAGRRISCAKSGSAFTQDDTVAYGYNNRSELTNAVAAVDSNYRYAYDFDDIGNREASSEGGTNSVYTANQLNQYTAVDDFTPEFDDDGNQTLIKTATGIWQVTYNGENRPTLWQCVTPNSLTPNSSTPPLISMSYDRMGRRVTKNKQRFVYDSFLQIANSELQTFIWDPTESEATRHLIIKKPKECMLYVTYDASKNVSELVFSSEGSGVAAHYKYAPFGLLIASTRNSAFSVYDFRKYTPFRFSSEYADDVLGLLYYNYRHYNHVNGRWLNFDPIDDSAFRYVNTVFQFDANGIDVCNNLYLYLENRLDATDKLGLDKCVCGPEVTSWLVAQMNINAQHHVIKNMREVVWPKYIPFFNLGWIFGALYDFKELVRAGAVWDFKTSQKFKSSNCPKGDRCQRTVTICGECVDYDVPGNIHYGYIGRAASLRAWFLHNRASAAQVGGIDPPDDVAAIDLGIELWEGANKDFCSVFNKYKDHLNHGANDKSKGCSVCNEEYK